MTTMKGIVLAGGSGTRLYPMTRGVSKQLLPVYDKPMIYYPLSVLMLGGIRDILVITTPRDRRAFEDTLGDGSQWGIRLTFKEQSAPRGLAEAFILGADHIGADNVALVLGDNLFYGMGLTTVFENAAALESGARIFGYYVKDPTEYGVVEFSPDGTVLSIEEKPKQPKSNYAVTGIYLYDATVFDKVKTLEPSARGELEITDVNNAYIREASMTFSFLDGWWTDAGTFDSLLRAATLVSQSQSK